MPGLLLHIGHSFGWGAWHLEPTVVACALVVIGLYVYRLPSVGRVEWFRPLAFGLGALAMFLALVSPLDAGADRLLSLHMLQHVVLTSIGPPLVLLGLPAGMLEPLLRLRQLRWLFARLTMPFVTAALFIVNMWLWHTPPVYEAALTNIELHVAMHIAFMATGLLF